MKEQGHSAERQSSAGRQPPARIAGTPVTEVKRYPDGREKRFSCTLVRREAGHTVLAFVSDQPNTVAGLDLPRGMVTHGHYWPDRPYNVYHWMRPDGRTIACYVNICDQVEWEPSRSGPAHPGGVGLLSWRDLFLDVLIRPDGRAEVLDRDELPADMDPALRRYAEAAVEQVLRDRTAILAEVEGDPDRSLRR